jgi:multimeric flavodoxin WrbA
LWAVTETAGSRIALLKRFWRARVLGAQTRTFQLAEQHIEFCRNCRECTKQPGVERGLCRQQDDLEPMLKEIEAADAVVLASPVNY